MLLIVTWFTHICLLQDTMVRKKAVSHFDGRQHTMIDNALHYCNPPDVPRVSKLILDLACLEMVLVRFLSVSCSLSLFVFLLACSIVGCTLSATVTLFTSTCSLLLSPAIVGSNINLLIALQYLHAFVLGGWVLKKYHGCCSLTAPPPTPVL